MPAPYETKAAREGRLEEICHMFPAGRRDDAAAWHKQATYFLELEESLTRPQGHLDCWDAKEWIDRSLQNRELLREQKLLPAEQN